MQPSLKFQQNGFPARLELKMKMDKGIEMLVKRGFLKLQDEELPAKPSGFFNRIFNAR